MGPSRQKMTNLPAKIMRFGIYRAGRDYYLCDGTAMYLLEDGLEELYDVTALFDETFALTRFQLFARNTAADQATYKMAVIDPETMEVKQVMKVGREVIKFLVEMRSEIPRYSTAYREVANA